MYITWLKIRWEKLDLTEGVQIGSFGQIKGGKLTQLQIQGVNWQFEPNSECISAILPNIKVKRQAEVYNQTINTDTQLTKFVNRKLKPS